MSEDESNMGELNTPPSGMSQPGSRSGRRMTRRMSFFTGRKVEALDALNLGASSSVIIRHTRARTGTSEQVNANLERRKTVDLEDHRGTMSVMTSEGMQVFSLDADDDDSEDEESDDEGTFATTAEKALNQEHEYSASAPSKASDSAHTRTDRSSQLQLVLKLVQSSKVLKELPMRLQVSLARTFQPRMQSLNDERGGVLWNRGDAPTGLILIARGEAELLCPDTTGHEVVIGRAGPGMVLGGLASLGVFTRHPMTVRCSQEEGAEHKDLIFYQVSSAEVEDLVKGEHAPDHPDVKELMKDLKTALLKDLRRKIAPRLIHDMACGFFSRYSTKFIKRLASDMNLRIYKPGETVFQENRTAHFIAVLLCGSVEIFRQDTLVFKAGWCGFTFGESALLEKDERRSATVKCSQDSEALVCLLHRNAFSDAVDDEEFQIEKERLGEQVRTRLTFRELETVFKGCNKTFLHALSSYCQVFKLEESSWAVPMDSAEEVMTLVQAGHAKVISKDGGKCRIFFPREDELYEAEVGGDDAESGTMLWSGSHVGLEAALNLRSGPPRYGLLAAEGGCTLIQLAWKELEALWVIFPDQVQPVLKACGLTVLPTGHPFLGKEREVWTIVQNLLRRLFMTMEVDAAMCSELTQTCQIEVVEKGCRIADPETFANSGHLNQELLVVLEGETIWKTGAASGKATAPNCFNQIGFLWAFGSRDEKAPPFAATLTAGRCCVVWHLSAEAIKAAKARLVPLAENATALRKQFKRKFQARLRNHKAFRRFSSEILDTLSSQVFLQTWLPGETIMTAGTPVDNMYVILKGSVEVISNGRIILSLDEGGVFGEIGLLVDGTTRQYTVKTTALCVCNSLHKDLVRQAFKSNKVDDAQLRQMAPWALGEAMDRRGSVVRGSVGGGRQSFFFSGIKPEQQAPDPTALATSEGNEALNVSKENTVAPLAPKFESPRKLWSRKLRQRGLNFKTPPTRPTPHSHTQNRAEGVDKRLVQALLPILPGAQTARHDSRRSSLPHDLPSAAQLRDPMYGKFVVVKGRRVPIAPTYTTPIYCQPKATPRSIRLPSRKETEEVEAEETKEPPASDLNPAEIHELKMLTLKMLGIYAKEEFEESAITVRKNLQASRTARWQRMKENYQPYDAFPAPEPERHAWSNIGGSWVRVSLSQDSERHQWRVEEDLGFGPPASAMSSLSGTTPDHSVERGMSALTAISESSEVTVPESQAFGLQYSGQWVRVSPSQAMSKEDHGFGPTPTSAISSRSSSADFGPPGTARSTLDAISEDSSQSASHKMQQHLQASKGRNVRKEDLGSSW